MLASFGESLLPDQSFREPSPSCSPRGVVTPGGRSSCQQRTRNIVPRSVLQSAALELPLLVLLLQEVWLDQEDVGLVKEGEEVTLMDWGNAIVQTISRSPDGKTITGSPAMHHT